MKFARSPRRPLAFNPWERTQDRLAASMFLEHWTAIPDTRGSFMDVFAVCNGPLLLGFTWVATKVARGGRRGVISGRSGSLQEAQESCRIAIELIQSGRTTKSTQPVRGSVDLQPVVEPFSITVGVKGE